MQFLPRLGVDHVRLVDDRRLIGGRDCHQARWIGPGLQERGVRQPDAGRRQCQGKEQRNRKHP